MTQEVSLDGGVDEQVIQFFDENVESWATSTIIEETKNIARAANMSDNYISSIKFQKTGIAKFKIVNVHPHAKRLEFGTKRHVITTKGGPQARNPPRRLNLPPDGPGNRFPESVDHPGTRPLLIMAKGQQIGFPKFVELTKLKLDEFQRSRE